MPCSESSFHTRLASFFSHETLLVFGTRWGGEERERGERRRGRRHFVDGKVKAIYEDRDPSVLLEDCGY
jgi:hypothetical protein